MENDLTSFHLACRPEFTALLRHFNLLFYGYGCKASLLASLFPDAKIFNLKLLKITEIAEDLVLGGYHTDPQASIREIDERLTAEGGSLLLVLINFNFDLTDLQGLKAIRIIGTIENIDFTFDACSIEAFNFIFRDLTTFVNYTDETLGINLFSNRTSSTLMVAKSVPERSRQVFKELLVLGSCSIGDLFNRVKIGLMMTNKKVLIECLNEFVDHGIVKISDGVQLSLNLTKNERASILADESMVSTRLPGSKP